MSKKLRFTVAPGGQINAEAEGYKGHGCAEAAKPLLEGITRQLGGEFTPGEPTADAYEAETQGQGDKQTQGG